jgi:hypothetical protein
MRLVDDARFLVGAAGKGCDRGDTTYVAQCLSRAVLMCAHALHGRDRVWATNEKGLVAAAGLLPSAPDGFAERAHAVSAVLGAEPGTLRAACTAAGDLVETVRARVEG